VRKIAFLCLLLTAAAVHAEVPEMLSGIWDGNDRVVFFEDDGDGGCRAVIVLKPYYGWYYDRAAEPDGYSAAYPRNRNAAAQRNPVSISCSFSGSESGSSGVWEITMDYPGKGRNIVPAAVDSGRIFLKFYTGGTSVNPSSNEIYPDFLRGNAVSGGFTLDVQDVPGSLDSLVAAPDGKFFRIRYWKTDMSPDSVSAEFTYGGAVYRIPRHLVSGGTVFTCAPGRRRAVRNIAPPAQLEEKTEFSADGRILMAGGPYLVRLADRATADDLMRLVREKNSRRAPDPPAPFPPSDVDWHWDLIELLEKDNALVQSLRARQREFGPRGADSGR